MDQELYLLAQRIKTCREQDQLTLFDLAERSGVAPSTVQKIEKGQMVPTIGVLMKIAKGLRRRVSYLIGDNEQPTEVTYRSNKQRSAVAATNRVRAERLAGDLHDPDFDAYEIIIPPGKGSGREPIQHRGDELVICLQGRIEYRVGKEKFQLGPGDSLHFKSVLPHAWRNAGKGTARMVAVGSFPHAFQNAEIEERRAPAPRKARSA
jgi:transcriptional regulator with XRE-family HTH domain